MTRDITMETGLPMTANALQAPTMWAPRAGVTPQVAGNIVCSFLDTASTSFGRATHYNTREEQQAAELRAHQALMDLDRSLYLALIVLPGVTDRSRQLGLKGLLSSSPNGVGFLTPGQEREVLRYIIQSLPVPRMLRMVQALRVGSEELGIRPANNSRTRKLVLRTLLGSPRLPLWSVKYRAKMLDALTHCWGQKMTGVVKSILTKDGRTWTAKERRILHANVGRFADKRMDANQCVRFILGVHDQRLNHPLFKAFLAAKEDLAAGGRLPKEVLEGIRSTYHPDVKTAEVLKLAVESGSMTQGQKMTVQRQAREAGVEVEFDPTSQDAVKLYIYGFEMGFSGEILEALVEKGKRAAATFPARYEKIGLVVDGSASMYGDKTQALRPLATTLAMRDMLLHVAEDTVQVFVGGERTEHEGIVRPQGDTALADGLVTVLHSEPEAVFVLSDGYENCPAGRFAETLAIVRDMGIETPVYHFSPVYAAETVGVRELAPGEVPTLPVRDPAGLGTSFLRGLIENEPVRGINVLIQAALTTGPVQGLLT